MRVWDPAADHETVTVTHVTTCHQLPAPGRHVSPPGRPRCVDCAALGDHVDVTRHRDRCDEHHARHTAWRRRRDQAVHRGTPRDAWQQAHPYEPYPRSAAARGILEVQPPDVRALRRSLAALAAARRPADNAHRNERQPDRRDQRDLLNALDEHAAVLERLLRGIGP